MITNILKNILLAVISPCLFLMGCEALPRPEEGRDVSSVTQAYKEAARMAQLYRQGEFGAVEPASRPRLQRYQAAAYEDVYRLWQMQQHHQTPTAQQISSAREHIAVMRSYLAALGATAASAPPPRP